MAIEAQQRETTARMRHLRTSPTKVRMVVELIRGQDVAEARDTLRLCDRAVSREVGKTLDSAIANAEHNDNLPEDELYVSRAFVDEGPTLKRWRPRARGRGVRVRKRTSHLTISVARYDDDVLERRRRAEAAAGGPARRRLARRRPTRAEPEHDHDHEHEHDGDDAADADAPAKRSTKKATAKKGTAKKATTKKSTATKKTATKKKAPAKKRAPKKDE
jgi:large subunit ribosomal protein L22